MKRSSVIAVLLTLTLVAGEAGASMKKAKSAEIGVTRSNSVGMKFVRVPAGSLAMGRLCHQFAGQEAFNLCLQEGRNDETPPHRVEIGAFWIGQYEVTQAQWSSLMENNPSGFDSGKVGENTLGYPVENVSWEEVQEFISRLNAREGEHYRLPTEAEWEYACKSGGKDQKYCGGDDADAVAWHAGNSGRRTHRVGTKRPNGLGIYDMSGNVWEWVSDWYDANYYHNSPGYNPEGPSGGACKVNRGGGWDYAPTFARAVARGGFNPSYRRTDLGFRLVINKFSK